MVLNLKEKQQLSMIIMTDDLPQVARICNIYVINGSTTVFKADCFTTQYNFHLRAYILQPLHNHSSTMANSHFIYHFMYGHQEFFLVKMW